MSRWRIIVWATLAVLLAGSGILLPGLPVSVIAIPGDRPQGTFGEILPGHPMIHEFHCPRDGLARIDLMMGTYDRRNSGRLELRIQALREDHKPDPARSRFCSVPMAELRDNRFQPFRFPRIPDSAGGRYRLLLSAPDAGPGRSVTVYRTARELEAPCLRVVTREPLGLLAGDLLDRASLWKPFPFGRPAFLGLLAVLALMGTLGLPILAFRAAREK